MSKIKFANSRWHHVGYGHASIVFVLDEHGENPTTMYIHSKSSTNYFDVYIVDTDFPPFYIKKPQDWIFFDDAELLAYVVQELDNTFGYLKSVYKAFKDKFDEHLDFLSQETQV